MDIMDAVPQFLSGYEQCADSSLQKIKLLVAKRGYRCLYLPSYSLELNPIEQFWSKVKHSLKREALMDNETLSLRIVEAFKMVRHAELFGYISHSINRFDDCMNRRPM